MPVRLPPVENKDRAGSTSVEHGVHVPVIDLNKLLSLPDTNNTQVKCSRAINVNLDRVPCVLGVNKNVKLPPIPNAKRARLYKQR